MPHLHISKHSWENFSEKIARYPNKEFVSLSTMNEWKSFLQKSGASHEIISNAQAIAEGKAHCIISGQQIGFGLNPLLILYKVFALEVACKEASKILSTPVYPIFWLQTEDHDLEEVSECGILSANNALNTFTLKNPDMIQLDPGASVGGAHMVQGFETQQPFHNYLTQHCHFPEQVSKILQESYCSKCCFATAFSRFLYSIMPQTKVSVFDVRSSAPKETKSALYKTALLQSKKIENMLLAESHNSTSEVVRITENSPLFFFHPSGPSSARFRLVFREGKYHIDQLHYTIEEKELLEKIENSPEYFSTSALLRPLLQDTLFKPLAYIGGASEIAYLRQMKPLYDVYNISEPLRFQRPSGIISTDAMEESLSQEEITSLIDSPKILERYISEAKAPSDAMRKTQRELMSTHVDPLLNSLKEGNSEDNTHLVKLRQKFEETLSWYFQKKVRDEGHAHGTKSSLHERALHFSFYGSRSQERTLSVLGLIGRFGRGVVDELFESFQKQMKF